MQNTTTPIATSFGIEINIFFGNLVPTGPPTGAGAALFSWSQPGGPNSYQGVQIATIPGQVAPLPYQGDVIFNVNVSGNAGDQAGFNAQFANVAGLDQNSTGDDQVALFTPISPILLFNEALPCLLYTSPSPRDATLSRMPSSA